MPGLDVHTSNAIVTAKEALLSYVHTEPITRSSSAAASEPLTAVDEKDRKEPGKLLSAFLKAHERVEDLKNGSTVTIDGRSLSVAEVAAVARHGAKVALSESKAVQEAVASSRRVIDGKVTGGKSVYGVSTGFGGSADTRTSATLALGSALLQHQQSGVLPSSTAAPAALPLLDPLTSTSMPEAWVRGAMLIRVNSLIRGHSGVRWELIEKMSKLLEHNITPLVPLRGSISASGDLSPLSYIAGTVIGNPSIKCYDGKGAERKIVPSRDALLAHGVEPLPLQSKEHLGILNGTAFSASVAALALQEATFLTLLGVVCTAMGVEALVGTQASFDPFIHDVARPHPGQVEAAGEMFDLLRESIFAQTEEEDLTIAEDKGKLRQDRYPLRTAPQFIGPQLETVITALDIVTQECNSTTDNPLIDGTTGRVHHGGNFQAMAVTTAMESTRLALHHVGKLLFAQATELSNPAMNRGLPPNLAATDPSLNYHGKGIDIAVASYVSELGYLANPVSTHVQSAEMHNQAVNSLALISGRKTIDAIQTLGLLTASYLYLLCQAMDLRALQREFLAELDKIVSEELAELFKDVPAAAEVPSTAIAAARQAFETTSTMDSAARMTEIASNAMRAVTDCVMESSALAEVVSLGALQGFKTRTASRAILAHDSLTRAYLSGERGPAPASELLRGTRPMYEFVRVKLGVQMHGMTNYNAFADDSHLGDVTIGQNISLIYEAIRDGDMHSTVAKMFTTSL